MRKERNPLEVECITCNHVGFSILKLIEHGIGFTICLLIIS
jgi:hypothetical protein